MAAVSEHEQLIKQAKSSGNLEQYADEVADALVEVWQGKASVEQALRLLDSKVIWHDSLLPYKALVGRDQLQEMLDLIRGAMPDLSLRLQRPLLTGEQGVVLGYWNASGTHTGALGPSLPPSGSKASWEGSIVIRTQPLEAAATLPSQPVEAQAAAPGGDGGAAAAAAPATSCLWGKEVWWSWDPIFLFRQLGWEQQKRIDATETAAAVVAPAAPEGDLAMRTAAEAGNAYATAAEAAEAAAAAVAAAARAAERLAEAGGSPDALAVAQAANRAVVELYFHTYNTGHYQVLDHIVHPDYQYDGLLDLGSRRGREAMAAMMGGWRDCIPDLVIGHEFFVAVGADKVTFRWVIRGTHSTPGSKLFGVPAAGARLLVQGVTTLTLHGGRIARKISHANAVHTLQQLGAAMHPPVPLPRQPDRHNLSEEAQR